MPLETGEPSGQIIENLFWNKKINSRQQFMVKRHHYYYYYYYRKVNSHQFVETKLLMNKSGNSINIFDKDFHPDSFSASRYWIVIE